MTSLHRSGVRPSGTPRSPWHQRWRHSLRWRLLGLFLLLALMLSGIFLFGMQRALGASWRDLVRPLVSDYVQRLAQDLGSPPDPARAQALAERLPLSIRIDGPRVHWRSSPQNAAADRPAATEDTPLDERAPVEPPPNAGWWNHRDHHDADLLVATSADGHRIRFGLDTERWVRRPRTIGWLTLAALLTLIGLAGFLVRRLFQPVHEIGAGVQRYGRGDFSQTIPVRRHDELGELAGQVNQMATDLSGMLEAKRALLLAISHELRSPLTRARLNAELVAEGPERNALLRDLGLMRDLISDLLESERLVQPHAALHREATDAVALAQDLLRSLAAEPDGDAAEPHGDSSREIPPSGTACSAQSAQTTVCALRLHLPDPPPPPGWVDRNRLNLLLRNLMSNALRHGGASPAQPAELSLSWGPGAAPGEPAWLELSLRDHGPGLPPEQLARLGQPFERPDAARQRSTGGVGLGLYLCRLVAEVHGGRLSLEAAQPGLRARVRMPWPQP